MDEPIARSFLQGGGEAGALMRGRDWAASGLGPPEGWPQPLKTLVGVMLGSNQPMFVAWGPERLLIYNDGYAEVCRDRHPAALGAPFAQVWRDIMGEAGPLLERGFAGEATHLDDIAFDLIRDGRPQEAHFSFSYTPVRGEDGEVAGLFCACAETTDQILADRRRDALLELDDRLRDVSEPDDLAVASAGLLARALGACRVGYGDMDPEAGVITVGKTWSLPGLPDVAGVHDFSDFGSYIDELRRGEAVTVEDVETDPRTFAHAAAFRALGIRAFLDAPVMEDGRVVAEVFAHAPAPRRWSDHDVAFSRAFAERTRVAIARRLAETALARSAARYRTLFESIDEGFCVVEFVDGPEGPLSDYVHLEANAAYERHAGISNIVGKTGRGELSKDEAEGWIAIFRRVLETGQSVRFERELAATGRHLEVACQRLEPAARRQLAILFQDVTARKRAEQALVEMNRSLERLVADRTADRDALWRLSSDIMLRCTREGVITAVNPAWTEVLGWREDELVGARLTDFLHPDDWIPTLKGARNLADGVSLPRVDNRYRCKDGGYRWISWASRPADNVLNAVGRDITQDKAREAELQDARERLRQSQKLESMGQLTGGVAHDFNNLLTPIVGTLDRLQRKTSLDDRERRLVSGALQSAERAKILVQRLLAFARRQPLQPVPVEIGRLIGDMSELIAGAMGPRIEVSIEAADGLPPAIADPNQLEMAILNLAVNARDAMPDGGRLRITAAAARVEAGERAAPEPGRYIRIIVADTGFGMDEATLMRAVEPFFSTKGVGKGTGLGLSMAHGLASQLGGALTIDSSPGAGAQVDLWLPVSDAPPAAAETAPTADAPASAAAVVLLVDDEELVRMVTADMMADLGYEVVEAESPARAIDLAREGLRPAVLVTDHLMPGMNGADLAAMLRRTIPDLKVLIASGYADDESGGHDLPRLTKPFTSRELAAALTLAVES